jgi:hypothetical protein
MVRTTVLRGTHLLVNAMLVNGMAASMRSRFPERQNGNATHQKRQQTHFNHRFHRSFSSRYQGRAIIT